MLRSSHDACGCSTQRTSTFHRKRGTLQPDDGQADRPNTPSDSVNLGSNPGPPAIHLPDMTVYFQFPRWHVEFPSRPRGSSKGWGTAACRLPSRPAYLRESHRHNGGYGFFATSSSAHAATSLRPPPPTAKAQRNIPPRAPLEWAGTQAQTSRPRLDRIGRFKRKDPIAHWPECARISTPPWRQRSGRFWPSRQDV